MIEDIMRVELAKYNVTDAALAEMREYMTLKIAGVADKEGALAVYKAKRMVATIRCEVESTRKELKADSLAYGRAVDGEAKRIIDKLLEIEKHLKGEETKVEDEKKRIEEEIFQTRLKRIGGLYPHKPDTWGSIIKDLTDADFEAKFLEAQMAHDDNQARLIEVEKIRRLQVEERERLRKEAVSQEVTRQYLLAETERARKQKEELAEKERELVQEKQRELARQTKLKLDTIRAIEERIGGERAEEIEAALKLVKEIEEAKQKAIDKIAREEELKHATEEAARKAVADRIEAERIAEIEKAQKAAQGLAVLARVEALKPDRWKMKAFAEALALVPVPQIVDIIAKKRLNKALVSLQAICNYIKENF